MLSTGVVFIVGILYLGYSDRLSQSGELGNNVSVESLAVDSDLMACLTNGLLSLISKMKSLTCMVIFDTDWTDS